MSITKNDIKYILTKGDTNSTSSKVHITYKQYLQDRINSKGLGFVVTEMMYWFSGVNRNVLESAVTEYILGN